MITRTIIPFFVSTFILCLIFKYFIIFRFKGCLTEKYNRDITVVCFSKHKRSIINIIIIVSLWTDAISALCLALYIYC